MVTDLQQWVSKVWFYPFKYLKGSMVVGFCFLLYFVSSFTHVGTESQGTQKSKIVGIFIGCISASCIPWSGKYSIF